MKYDNDFWNDVSERHYFSSDLSIRNLSGDFYHYIHSKYNNNEIKVGKEYFSFLIKVLLRNSPYVYLEISFYKIVELRIREDDIRYIHRGFDTSRIKEVYDMYVYRYVNILNSYLSLNKSEDNRDFLSNLFIKDKIECFCKKGTSKVNILYMVEKEYELLRCCEMYYRSKVSEANSKMIYRLADNSLTEEQNDYFDMLFDISFLTSSDIISICYFTRNKIHGFAEWFFKILKNDNIDYR